MPVPKPPGTIAVPPAATGKKQSRTRCPVRNGTSGASRRRNGRGRRTGQRCASATTAPPSSTTTGSSTVALPARTSATRPSTPGGTWTGWTSVPPRAVPTRAPGPRTSPGATEGSNSQRSSRSSAGSRTPRPRKSPCRSARRVSGRCTPSKIWPRSPGPSSTHSGSPVASAGSPRARPMVSSYTWTVVRSPSIRMTSPSRCSSPTKTTSLSPGDGEPLHHHGRPGDPHEAAPLRGGTGAKLPGGRGARHGPPRVPPSFTA